MKESREKRYAAQKVRGLFRRRPEPKSEEMTDQNHLPFIGFSSLIKWERTNSTGVKSYFKLICQRIRTLFRTSLFRGKSYEDFRSKDPRTPLGT